MIDFTLKGVFLKKILLFFTIVVSIFAGSIADIHSIKTDFIQNITNEENQTISYSGKFYAISNSKALWIYKKPIKKFLYFLNKKVIIIEPELEQVIFSKLEKLPKILNILKSAKKENGIYIASCCNNTYKIFTKDDKINKITYKDKVGNSVEIKFYNQETNLILDDKIFHYTIPEDYDILQNN